MLLIEVLSAMVVFFHLKIVLMKVVSFTLWYIKQCHERFESPCSRTCVKIFFLLYLLAFMSVSTE